MRSLVAFILTIISLFSTITAATVLESTSDPSFARKISFWAQFEKTLNDTTPPKHFIGPLNENQPVWLHRAEEAARTPRPINVDISYYAIGKLNTTHHQIVGNVTQLAPKIPFVANTSGVVMIAKKEDLEVTLIAIKMLRRANTTVPIELFLNTTKEDYNDICNKALPVLNVKCLYFSDFLSKPMMYHFGMTHQTFKALSILLSSFENVLFLESDSIAVSSLDALFISSPFTEYGLVVWPDLWTETVSDIFFNITGRRAPEFLTHASTDSGQLMISKTKHGETLILASYYSLFGKNQYYILFNQNAWGDGDKEAYHNAAEVLKKPYYRVNTFVEQLNFYKGKDQEMLAMMQFHPVDDYRKYVLGNDSIKVSRLFIHTDYCRVNITQLMYPGTEAVSEEGEPRRIWASKTNMIELFGYDVEKAVWECAIESADIFHSGITDILYHNLRSKVNRYYRIVFEESGEKFDTYGLLSKLVMIIASLGVLVLVVNKFVIKKSKDAVLATKGQ